MNILRVELPAAEIAAIAGGTSTEVTEVAQHCFI